MASRKDELLERVDSDTLLKLAQSVSESPIRSGATRSQLQRIVKESFSVEEIRRKAKLAERDHKSKGLTRNELAAGGIGQIFLALAGAISIFLYSISLSGIGMLGDYRTMGVWNLGASILLLVFAILLAVSIMKISEKVGRSHLGTATWIIALISAITSVTLYTLTALGAHLMYIDYYYITASPLHEIMAFSSQILVATTLVLLGVFLLTYRGYSPDSDLWMAGGIMYIVAAASGLSPFFSAGSLFIAAIIGASCFLTRKGTE